MKNTKLTQLDNNQIHKMTFDEENDAQRVVLVAGTIPDIKVDVDPKAITDAIQKGLESFKPSSVPNQSSGELQLVEIPVIVKETVIERIEVPVIIKEIEYREIKVPIEIIKMVEVEKPIFIKEQQIQVVREDSKETKYLRIAVGCLIVLELITLLIGRH